MYQVIIVVHVLLGLGVIGLILIQQGKGADAGAAFGSGGGSGSVFGAQGAASFLSRTTAILATLFFTTSLSLAVLGGQQSKKAVDLMDNVEVEQKTTDVPFADKAATPDSVPAASATDIPTVPASAGNDKSGSDNAAKVDSGTKATGNKTKAAVATKAEKSVPSDKKTADKKTEKKHDSEKKKTTDKAKKKHTSDKTDQKE